MLSGPDPCANPVAHKSAPIGRNRAVFNDSPGRDLCKEKPKRAAAASTYTTCSKFKKKKKSFIYLIL